jgi:ADP-ribose pyrophosphatase YjhB (NUDIX family)
MRTKVLIIGVVKKGDSILMRKKPDGSPPYKETWYIFGAERVPGEPPETSLINHIKKTTGIDVDVTERLSWDTEVKHDLDGIEKLFFYLDTLCEYKGGELNLSEGIEKLEWVPIADLGNYDIVPPSRKLFRKHGYIK